MLRKNIKMEVDMRVISLIRSVMGREHFIIKMEDFIRENGNKI